MRPPQPLETTATADTIESGILTGTDAAGEEVYAMANVLVQALYSGESSTKVSAFAAGSNKLLVADSQYCICAVRTRAAIIALFCL